jgi:hypothetical protein
VIHPVDQRPDLLDREVADGLLKHLLFFGQECERGADGGVRVVGHRVSSGNRRGAP